MTWVYSCAITIVTVYTGTLTAKSSCIRISALLLYFEILHRKCFLIILYQFLRFNLISYLVTLWVSRWAMLFKVLSCLLDCEQKWITCLRLINWILIHVSFDEAELVTFRYRGEHFLMCVIDLNLIICIHIGLTTKWLARLRSLHAHEMTWFT